MELDDEGGLSNCFSINQSDKILFYRNKLKPYHLNV